MEIIYSFSSTSADKYSMPISWFPGHMHKAGKELRKIVSATHAFIEVRDARIPLASANPLLDELAGDKPVLIILNKEDLANPSATTHWVQHFSKKKARACISTGPDKQNLGTLVVAELENLLSDTAEDSDKHQALIFGVPNVGKSTLLNALAGRKIAKTGNEPAVTRALQRVRLGDSWYLIDSPGMMKPRLDDQHAALLLALTGTIRQTAVDVSEIGWLSAELLLSEHPGPLLERYGITETPSSTEELMELIALSIGGLSKNGNVNWTRAAESLLNDFRSGKIGRMTLEQAPQS